MKKYLVLILFVVITSTIFAQNNYQDVVYLKNGSIIHGVITEQVPNKSIKIETADGNVFIYQMDEIEKLTKEKPIVKAESEHPTLKYTFGKTISPVGGEKSPFLAGFLSFIIPGVGQFYNGDVEYGLLCLGSNILVNSIMLNQISNREDASFSLLCALTIDICSTINAVTVAKRVNKARV